MKALDRVACCNTLNYSYLIKAMDKDVVTCQHLTYSYLMKAQDKVA